MNREDAKGAKRRVVTLHCPICRGASAHRDENSAFPFCSDRCRTIDLGNWLGESYRIAGSPVNDSTDDSNDDSADNNN